ncbi:hypothetical protein D3C72_2015480 [compost metagenome]
MISLKARLTAVMRCSVSVIITPSAVLSKTVAAWSSFSCICWRSVMSRAMVSMQASSPMGMGWAESSQRRICPALVRTVAVKWCRLPWSRMTLIMCSRSDGSAQSPRSRVERSAISWRL